MRRGKVELKRIEDKSSRQVTFSKRRSGLMKKARELSVLCDVEMAVIIFSGRGKLYEFCSGPSLGDIIDRYHVLKGAEVAVYKNDDGTVRPAESRSLPTGAEALQMVRRHLDGEDMEQLNMIQLSQLEKQLDSLLRKTRTRKKVQLAQEEQEMDNEIGAILNDGNITNQLHQVFLPPELMNNQPYEDCVHPFPQGMLQSF